jgi:hypothetical protein
MRLEACGKLGVGADLFGAFSGLPAVPGGPERIMRCPTCGQNTPDDWKWFTVEQAPPGSDPKARRYARGDAKHELRGPDDRCYISIAWMQCANADCKEIVLRVHERAEEFRGGVPISHTDTWLIRPRYSTMGRTIDPIVSKRFRHDFLEAAAILDASPRMSTVLSRRILADLLEEYAGRDEFRLGSKLKAFSADTQYPFAVRKNAQHLNEIADFGAHTQKDDQAQIIDVDRDEAEWTLDFLERLFDLFIITPAHDEAMRDSIEEKRKQAHRDDLPRLPDEPQGKP